MPRQNFHLSSLFRFPEPALFLKFLRRCRLEHRSLSQRVELLGRPARLLGILDHKSCDLGRFEDAERRRTISFTLTLNRTQRRLHQGADDFSALSNEARHDGSPTSMSLARHVLCAGWREGPILPMSSARAGRSRIGKARRAEHGDEDLRLSDFSSQPVDDDRYAVARIIDEKPFHRPHGSAAS
jgi:hypothetical protein